jgi:alpha/beta hydrolase fold
VADGPFRANFGIGSVVTARKEVERGCHRAANRVLTGARWNELPRGPFLPSLYPRPEPNLDCRPTVRTNRPYSLIVHRHKGAPHNGHATIGAPRRNMKRGITILVSLSAVLIVAYFTASKWAIRHETLTFNDPARDNRPVAVDIAVRRDKEMQANAAMIKLPVTILNHGNTVKFTEYSFLANVFAARGYMTISIQHDLPTDAPMVTKVGELYVGRLPQIQRGIANIRFAVEEMKKVEPNADYDHLTVVGHSMGGDISVYFAKMYPDQIREVVTLDNLRVPFMTDGKFKILSFRSKDPVFKPDPGVIPPEEVREKSGITVVQTGYQHTDMSDRGSDDVKSTIQGMLDKFLDDDSPQRPIETKAPPALIDPGPVAPYVPSVKS